MSRRMLFTFAAMVFWLIPGAAPAATGPLFPLQLGAYNQYDGSDLSGHTWQASMWVVAENINLNSQTYCHIRNVNWDPYGWPPRFGSEDLLIRSDEVAAYTSMGGPEWRQFQTTGTPQNWTYYAPPGQTQSYNQCQVNGVMTVSVPYGGPYQAYENQLIHHELNPPNQSPPWYSYLVPGLGLIKTVQTDVPFGGTPMTEVLKSVGAKPVSLFPLKTGMSLIFNASDAKTNKWQMRLQILEQVMIGNQTYFHGRVINFDPYEGDLKQDFYIRSTDKAVYISDGVNEHIEFQAASPNTSWNFPDPPGTLYKQITAITPINVLGGSYLAYVHDSHYEETGFDSPHYIDYVVPGLGFAKMVSWWTGDPDRAPLIFTLTRIIQGNAGAAVNLLLLD